MCLPKRCERLKTYFIIILSSGCAPTAASSYAVFAAALIRVCHLDENIRAHLRLYLMTVIVHGLHALTNTRRICSRPTSLSAMAAAASSSFTFLICLVRRWIFPIILAFPSVRFIHSKMRFATDIAISILWLPKYPESELYNMSEDVRIIIIIIILRVRRMMIGNGRGWWAKACDTHWDFDVIKRAHIFFLTTS